MALRSPGGLAAWRGDKLQHYGATRYKAAMRRHRSNLLLRGKGALVNPSTVHAVAKPSEVAKAARMPNRRIVIESAVGARALRASGSAQGSRQWARWARDRGESLRVGLAGVEGVGGWSARL